MTFAERPAAGEPEGLVILHHGRGADEYDLLGLADVLDPERRLRFVTPGGPLRLPGAPGRHWYVVPRVGFPDPDTFAAGYSALADLHDELFESMPPEQTVLGGFSQGTVMSYALGLGAGRPAPAGFLAFSGFIPTAPGWRPSLTDRQGLPVFIAHGRRDPVIDVEFGRAAREQLEQGGLKVDYHESDVAHQIDPAHIAPAQAWLRAAL
jgi:phospholipase/carboxylesterase